MINSAHGYKVVELLSTEKTIIYKVPRYQREYKWNKRQWEDLFDDLMENDSGYYLGSMICVNKADDSLKIAELELIDGQQRMATISILLLSVYSSLRNLIDWKSEDEITDITNLKNRLILKDLKEPRLVLQQQNYNNDDYRYLLCEENLIQKQVKPKNFGNRLIAKAYRYFKDRTAALLIDEVNNQEIDDNEKKRKIIDFLSKLYESCMVKIEVDSHADAYVLFESLNNRGLPLSAVDIIKNNLLAALERKKIGNIDGNFKQWQLIMENLGNDYVAQDRFFRQYLNTFKLDFPEKIKFSIATKSNLIQIYEKLIDEDPEKVLSDISRASEIYATFIAPNNLSDDSCLKKPLLDLARIRGAAAYILLLYLFTNRNLLNLDDSQLKKIIKFLVSFFVRRNITDLPPTRDLTRIFMDIITSISSKNGDAVFQIIQNKLVSLSAHDSDFKTKLKGDIYAENADSTRFLLAALAEDRMTKETWKDFWAYKKNGKDYLWTIEHVLPQGENLPECWIKMIADGDAEKAREIQENYAHKIGNLTLSGYNANLSNNCFEGKRDKTEDGKYIGYKNGLKLNEDLATVSEWKAGQIEARTERLADRIMQLFPLD